MRQRKSQHRGRLSIKSEGQCERDRRYGPARSSIREAANHRYAPRQNVIGLVEDIVDAGVDLRVLICLPHQAACGLSMSVARRAEVAHRRRGSDGLARCTLDAGPIQADTPGLGVVSDADRAPWSGATDCRNVFVSRLLPRVGQAGQKGAEAVRKLLVERRLRTIRRWRHCCRS